MSIHAHALHTIMNDQTRHHQTLDIPGVYFIFKHRMLESAGMTSLNDKVGV
jgi:hypothetical protein